MGSFTNATELSMLDLFLGASHSTAAFPATVYVGLFTVAPTETGGGTEVTGGSYARVAVPNLGPPTGWNAAVTDGSGFGSKKNAAAITFPNSTAPWGTIVAFGIFSAASAGVLYAYGSVTPNLVVGTSTQPYFPASSLVITLD